MTETEIVNLSLSKLGANLIIRLGDASLPGSHHGDLLYKPTLERILRDFPWACATKEKALAQETAPAISNYLYSFALPADFVRLGELPEDGFYLRNEDFCRTGRMLHTNKTPAVLRYVSNAITPDEFDADFREAFVVLLASELATPLLQSPQLAQALIEEYLSVSLPKAKTVDARETDSNENYGPYRAIANSPLCNSRFQR